MDRHGSRMTTFARIFVAMMILGAFSPMIAPAFETTFSSETTPAGEDRILEPAKVPMQTSGRAPCPAAQTDAGTPGDAGNSTATAKSLGTDPSQANFNACLDAQDTDDFFSGSISANKDVVVQLHVPTGTDYDLYILDSTGSQLITYSAGTSALERVQFTTNSTTAGTYHFVMNQYSGDGPYTFDVWTNNSVPKPDLSVHSISGPLNATAGDIVNLTYTVENAGPGDTNNSNPYDVVVLLSDDQSYDWGDTFVTSLGPGPHILAGGNSVENVQVTVPTDVEDGDWYWIIWPDGYNNVTETDDLNNNNASSATTAITGMPCPTLNDASTGGDIGDVESAAHDLGSQFTGTITGCLAGGDKADMYKVSMERGQNLTVVMTADNWDADLDLRLWNTSTSRTDPVDNSALGESNESVTTAGSDADGAADTYYINVSHYSGLANYTLDIWVNGTPYVEPFDCGPDNDFSEGADAGDSPTTALNLGDNPDINGFSCMDPEDQKDVYAFTLSGMHGMRVMMNQPEGQDFHLSLEDPQGAVIHSMNLFNSSVQVNTSSLADDQLDGAWVIVVDANGGEGWYDLTFESLDPPMADLNASSVNCPAAGLEVLTGTEMFVGAEIDSLGGPNTDAFGWSLNLVNESGESVLLLLEGTYTDSLAGQDGVIITSGGFVALEHTIPSGDYTCVLTVDASESIAESDETNNVLTSDVFNIVNYEEMWADDTDRDGVENDVDACPTTPGNSTEDRLGCQDIDGDGYSNGGDAFIYEPSQWNDTDGDGFGDNPEGVFGDACPDVLGVADGTNGTGCEVWHPDTDGDGIIDANDACANTEAGVTVDALGCPIVDITEDADGDGVPDLVDQCPDTLEGTQVGVLGCLDTDGDGIDDFADYCLNTPEGAEIDDRGCAEGEEAVEPTGNGGGDGGDGNGDGGDGNGDDGPEKGSSSNSTLMIVGGLAGFVALIVIILATVLLMRGRSGAGRDLTAESWDAVAISPEQQAYEAQLVGMGYTPEQARAYASQYFQ